MSAAPTVALNTELVRFVLTRFDDDEAELRRLARRSTSDDALISRMRSDAIARRQVVGHVQQLLVLRDQPNEKAVRDMALHILRSLAMPYAEHRDFQEEWRVSVR